jgi:hypothetical protein
VPRPTGTPCGPATNNGCSQPQCQVYEDDLCVFVCVLLFSCMTSADQPSLGLSVHSHSRQQRRPVQYLLEPVRRLLLLRGQLHRHANQQRRPVPSSRWQDRHYVQCFPLPSGHLHGSARERGLELHRNPAPGLAGRPVPRPFLRSRSVHVSGRQKRPEYEIPPFARIPFVFFSSFPFCFMLF